jgi:phosphomannomutase
MVTRIRFGTDGWRGGIAEDYTFETVRYCAQGTADHIISEGLADRGMIVGYDMRFRSEDFARAVAEVLAGNGIKAYLADHPAPTPVLSASIIPHQAAGGIWITASHNPPTDNGFKLRSSYGGAASPETLRQVEDRILAAQQDNVVKTLDFDRAESQGLVQLFDPDEGYRQGIEKLIDTKPIREAGLRVLVDPMWGVGQGWFTRLLSDGPTRVREIHAERNPLFPDMRRPEPIDDNLQVLLKEIPVWKADVGLATDGDADRVGMASEKGVFVNQLQVYALLALYLLEVRGMRGPLVRTLSTTVMANKLADLYDVPVYQTAVGFKYVAPEMMRVDAIMGGEESGGFAFANHIPERDGILAGLYLLDLMVQMNMKPTELIDHIHSLVGVHFYDRVDRPLDPDRKAEIQQHVRAAKPEKIAGLRVTEIVTVDGFQYRLEDGGWMLIRFSGTEPVIRVYCETTHGDKVSAILAEGLALAGLEA